jgi:hypothetical protein
MEGSMAHTTFQIGELAARSGMTPDTLRYYERSAQLLPNLRRAPSRFGEPPTPSDPNCSLLFTDRRRPRS